MKNPREARAILRRLETQHPNADTELAYRNPFELLVATILSAQTTDQRVNLVTPALFAGFPDAPAMAKAMPSELETLVKATGFFRAKSRSLLAMAQALVDHHGGHVPSSMEALVELPGVGRKTANVVLGHAFKVPGLPVDRHVLRVANRIGLARSDSPEVVEQQLGKLLPPERWTLTSDTLILHGRRVCKPRPLCDRCVVRKECDFFQSGGLTRPAHRRGTKRPIAARRRNPARRA
ncbi:MAG: endonuclease III [Acidobacteria bacterium]|nr:endonuclease III [Acidobacteriota bacterium]MBI3263094.1 endonuclease III [Acidobacteriota bacterium]